MSRFSDSLEVWTRVDSSLAYLGRIVSIFSQGERSEAGPLAYGEYLSLKRDIGIFEWIGAARVQPASIGLTDQSAVLSVAAVTPDLARALNLPVQHGIVISRRMWRNHFGAKNGIAAELFCDSLVISLSGGAAGFLLAFWTSHIVPALLSDQDAEQLLPHPVLPILQWHPAQVPLQ